MADVNKNLQQARDDIGTESATSLIPKQFSERISITQGPIVQEILVFPGRNTYNSGKKYNTGLIYNAFEEAQDSVMILGNGLLGELGIFEIGESQIDIIKQVTSINNKFIDKFDLTLFKDTNNTTATWTGTGSVTFTSGQVAESTQVYKNSTTITKITLSSTEVSGSFDYKVKSSLAGTFEAITLDTELTLAVSGTELYFQVTENAASAGEISQIIIDYL